MSRIPRTCNIYTYPFKLRSHGTTLETMCRQRLTLLEQFVWESDENKGKHRSHDHW